MTQLIEQITNNTTNTTNINNELKAGFGSLLDANAKIFAGLGIIQTNIEVLSAIHSDLRTVRNATTQISDDQSRIVARLDGVIQSLGAAHVELTAIAGFASTLPGILSVLNTIQVDVRRLAERPGPDLDRRLAPIIAQLAAIEKNTRPGTQPPPPIDEPPPPTADREPDDPILACMRSGLNVYFMGPLDSIQGRSRCMTQDSLEKAAKAYSWLNGNELIPLNRSAGPAVSGADRTKTSPRRRAAQRQKSFGGVRHMAAP